ncbi:P-type conjugative transfer protein TrbJ [Shewanella indica]|uniref:P-type conjugative transfer protein TrbJ n=1 Tax=Shewanella indica TaxID=768528 RepID=A0ABU4QJE6_9GAMM|nr:P-type conjugative transfer protein TrbJ [Shewanella indica]MDX6018635.1 P-type conjugative transfer protein TrbJ [Shewanella indica]
MIWKNLAAKIALAIALTTGPMLPAVQAGGIPVIDVTNIVQTTVSASESVSQTLKLIQQYQTQLQQYQNMLQNTMAPSTYIWDNATVTMNNLRNAIDSLAYYKTTLGDVDTYLAQYGDLDYYESSPCLDPNGTCTAAEWQKLEDARRLGFSSQKRANDALFRGLDAQQDAMQADAIRLEQLQAAAQSSTGQMEAIGYANQLASQQANQLLQIRGLLIAQQNAATTRMQAQMAEEARLAAASKKYRASTDNLKPSTGKTWGPSDLY